MSPMPAGPRKVLRWLRRCLGLESPPVRSPAMLAADLIAQGDVARDRRDWAAAAEAYGAALDHLPGAPGIAVQQGHMLKEAGRLDDALTAYRLAGESAPFDAAPWLYRAHVLKSLDRRDEAADAFVEALRRDPSALGARDELISVGARSRLPRPTFGAEPAARELATIGRALDTGLNALRDLVQVSTYPLDAYDAFRRAFPVAPPQADTDARPIVVVVDALGAQPAAVGRTLDSLVNQRNAVWSALVRSDDGTRDHPVASLQTIEPRITFISADALSSTLAPTPGVRILALPAGVVLDPTALDWLGVAARRTGAAAVYADHDHHEDHWRLGPLHQRPAFQSMPDEDDLATSPCPPATVLIAPELTEHLIAVLATGVEGTALGRSLIGGARTHGSVAHLPRLLSSVWAGSLADDVPAPVTRSAVPVADDARILVVIPTRDQAGLLEVCVRTLRAFAERPDAVEFLIVDNRSVEDETRRVIEALTSLPGVATRTMDAPFNWARLNTETAKGGDQPLIVFANNDIEAMQQGWDRVVRRELARPDIGVVGARLLYADHSLQHGGVVLGMGEGRTMHEGLGAAPLEDGPMGRYRRTRPVAAVTGAFMAVRRETFERLGGFDERLAVGYNDIDFCLRARADGLKVIYAADLSLIHHESRTRGLNDAPDKIAWDDTELKRLFATWGETLFQDPGVNPHWGSASGRPFDGYREPTLTQVLDWLDRSARPRPWMIDSAP